MRRLRQLCQDRPDVLDLIDQARQRKHGGDHMSKFDNVQLAIEQAPTGNSTDAALRRLRKDRPDLHQRVIMGPVFLLLSEITLSGTNFP